MTALPQLGTTLYSFTPEYHSYKYSFDDLVRVVGENNLGPGLEIVGFQSVKGFPHVDSAFAGHFRDLLDRYELVPTSLGVNVDRAIRRDRVLTFDETVEYLRLQLDAAHRLGFSIARMQNLATADVIEALIPHAEKLGVTMAMELHAPETTKSQWVLDLLELYERTQSSAVGFLPDFGASTRRLASSLFEEYAARGVPDHIQNLGRDTYADGKPADPLIGQVAHSGESIDSILFVQGVGLFGHMDPRDWRDIAPWIRHVHGKFYEIDENGDEPTIDYETILGILVDVGYEGYISSEWEAWHWVSDPDAIDMIRKHHALEARILSAAATPTR